MNLFGVMDVSASALQAERVRAEVVASNMANAETTRTPDGGPYQRHHVVFEAQGGEKFSGVAGESSEWRRWKLWGRIQKRASGWIQLELG